MLGVDHDAQVGVGGGAAQRAHAVEHVAHQLQLLRRGRRLHAQQALPISHQAFHALAVAHSSRMQANTNCVRTLEQLQNTKVSSTAQRQVLQLTRTPVAHTSRHIE